MRGTLIRVLIAASLVGGAVMASAAAAQAFDAFPCGPEFSHNPGGTVQYCPDWAPNNSIPVFRGTDAGSGRVGWIYAPGNDWYICQTTGLTYNLGSFANNWWA